jgi:hypothetical protein
MKIQGLEEIAAQMMAVNGKQGATVHQIRPLDPSMGQKRIRCQADLREDERVRRFYNAVHAALNVPAKNTMAASAFGKELEKVANGFEPAELKIVLYGFHHFILLSNDAEELERRLQLLRLFENNDRMFSRLRLLAKIRSATGNTKIYDSGPRSVEAALESAMNAGLASDYIALREVVPPAWLTSSKE